MMTYAVIGLFFLFLVIAYIVVQGTRASMAWRREAERGNVEVIRDIIGESIKHWSSQKRPKPTAPEVWRGIQSMQLTGATADYVRVSCVAESEYAIQDGNWIEIRNPLHEGFAITAKAADMLFYELGHHKPDTVQIDIYTTYRSDAGVTRRECVLSTKGTREQARQVDWEEWPAEDIVRSFDAKYRLSDTGRPLPVEPHAPPPEPEPEPTPAAPAEAAS